MTTPEELRSLVAERVMGCELKIVQDEEGYDEEWWVFPEHHPDDGLAEGRLCDRWLPDYDARDTWRVIDRMGELGFYMLMDYDPDGTAYVGFGRSRHLAVGMLDTTHCWPIKKAVCLAALEALDEEAE